MPTVLSVVLIDATLKILVVCLHLEKCSNIVVNSNNVEISTFDARGPKLLVVDGLIKVARWHLSKPS